MRAARICLPLLALAQPALPSSWHCMSACYAKTPKPSVEDCVQLCDSTKERIPLIIHQFWTGPRAPPQTLIDSCRAANPRFTHMMWSDNNLTSGQFDLENKHLYDCQPNNGKSDVLRYEVLLKYGGFWVDADTLCRRSFFELTNRSFVVGYHHFRNPNLAGTKRYDDKFVASGIIGATPQHPVLRAIVDDLSSQPTCKPPAWATVGPKVLTRHLLKHPKIEVLPFYAFVPYHFTETIDKDLQKAIKYNSYCLNLWGTTRNWDIF